MGFFIGENMTQNQRNQMAALLVLSASVPATIVSVVIYLAGGGA